MSGIAAFYKIPNDLVIENNWKLPVNRVEPTGMKPNGSSFWRHVKESFVDFAKNSTCHGLSRIIDDRETCFVRSLWFLAVVTFLIVTSGSIYHSTTKNLLNPSISTELIPRQSNRKLPAVHLCDSSIFNKRVLEEFDIDDELASYLALSYGPTVVNYLLLANKAKQLELKTKLDNILRKHSVTVDDIYEQATLKCEDMLLSCIVNSVYYTSSECCSKFFGGVSFPSITGSCISTYFGQQKVTQKHACQMFGFVVFLKSNNNKFEFDQSIVSAILSSRKGFVFSVSDEIIHPAVWLQSRGLLASAGRWVSVTLTKTETDMEEALDSWIIKDTCAIRYGTEYSYLTPDYPNYSKDNCNAEERVKNLQYMLNDAECTMAGLPYSNWSICHPNEIVLARSRVDESKEFTVQSKCVSDCLLEDYTAIPTSTALELKDFGSLRLGLSNDSGNSAVGLHFYLKDFSYMAIVRHYPSLTSWIGEIGGNLGLFLGSSLMTIMELIMLCYHCCSKRHN